MSLARGAMALAGAALLASCKDDNSRLLGVQQTGANSIFASYVAIGNSITAGYQSSGITATTQRQSYANLLATQMQTRFALPILFGRGCAPPVTNFQTQTGGAAPTIIAANVRPTICDLRDPAFTTDIINNVAVPGARVVDPTAESGSSSSNILTSLFLGGATQVERALMAEPTFASIWIGNNDVLGPAISSGGTAASLATITSQANFEASYNAMTDQLVAGAPGIKGVLIGVVNVTNAPIMFPAAALQNATFKAGFDALAGTTTAVDPSCDPANPAYSAAIINTFLAFQIRSGAHPAVIACTPGGASGALPAPIGDILVLHPAEQTLITNAVNGYNAYIQAEANALGFAYWDPNPTLVTLRAANTLIRQVPTLGATGTFGTGMSLDGVHPAAAVHREIANALIPIINTKYETTLQLVP